MLKIRLRYASKNPEGTKREVRLLRKVFKELACMEQSSSLSRESLLKFIELPGLLGEQLFKALDEDQDERVDVFDFSKFFTILYKGTYPEVVELLFKIFDFNNAGYLKREDIQSLLNYLPKKCKKCGKKIHVKRSMSQAIENVFRSQAIIRYDEFAFIFRSFQEIGTAMLTSIFSYVPSLIDSIFSPQDSVSVHTDTLVYNGRSYNFEFKNNSLYYYQRLSLVGIIYAASLFIEPSGERSFLLRNTGFTYQFECENTEKRNAWVSVIKTDAENSLDNYEIYEVVGEGAFGSVRRGVNKHTGKQVAIKSIEKRQLDTVSETRQRREIEILRSVSHPNLLGFECAFETVDELFIVSEFAPSGSLFNWLSEREFKISEGTARSIVRDLASVLHYLHTMGIIHRDVKPENVLLDWSSGRPVAKLIDFGLACMLGPEQMADEVVGTLKYAAPEVVARRPYREAVDAWSLGVLTYILLVGKMPFYGRTDQDIVNRIVRTTVRTNGEEWKHVSSPAKIVIEGLLNRRVNARMVLGDLLDHDWLCEIEEGVNVDMPGIDARDSPFNNL